ncbi:MAG: FAD-dependent oxidoreductase [Lachnospiraceae bacterium]|nr:FAD-dependent oxidoreductase [Lachnospiraceae bacterium]
MLIIEQFKTPINVNETKLKGILAGKLRIDEDSIKDFSIVKKSLDARYKPDLFNVYSLAFSCPKEERLLNNKKIKNLKSYSKPKEYDPRAFFKEENSKKKIAVIGMGPAGLLCGLCLARAGFKPLILERGKDADSRRADIEEFWKNGKLLLNSNVQFGEGGAGTFSDGKLNTLIKDKEGRISYVLKTFIEFGAKKEILYDAKPHIGTDVLINVVKNIREEIKRLGGEVRFESQVTDFLIDNDNNLKALIVNDEERIEIDKAVLCIGHSARDTFKTLDERKVFMEQKPFAVGFRVQHPQSIIDKSQYGFDADTGDFYPGAAAYKLACHTSKGRNVYTFCMCPGGYVVNASSEFEALAINGMSYSGRSGKNANSAVLINVDVADFSTKDVLSGVDFQRVLEQKAYALGKGRIPYCRLGDFKNAGSDCSFEITPEFKGEIESADLSDLLPEVFTEAFVEGMSIFGQKIKGFDSKDCIVAGVESRSSSPVRITRDENLVSLSTKGLYPCGEGAGYAGGIVSAAVDGIKAFEAVL